MELKGLDSALSLLSHFSAENERWGVRELSARTGIGPSVVQRILATYQRHGFLQQCPDTRKYRLGVRLWELGTVFRDQLRLGDEVLALLQRTAHETGETVYLNTLEKDDAICVQISEGAESVRVAIRLGERTPLHAGSRGKVMLAFLPDAHRAEILEAAFGGRPAAEATGCQQALEGDLAAIRRQGWCLTRGERLTDVVGISVPIFDRRGGVTASVTAGGPLVRMTDAKVAHCIPLLLSLGRAVQAHFHKFG
jgi:DNA-binding IclR family transcriptional regulator